MLEISRMPVAGLCWKHSHTTAQSGSNRQKRLMSFYIKLFVLVVLGTILSLLVVQTLVSSTDDMTNRFSTTSTTYLDRTESDEQALTATAAKPVKYAESQNLNQTATDKEIENSRGIGNTEDPDEQREPLTDLPIPVAEDQEAELTEEEPEEIAELEEREKEIGDEIVSTNKQPSGNGTATRSDSDADIVAMNNATKVEDELAKPEMPEIPETGIVRTTNQDSAIKKRAKTVRALDLAYAPPEDSGCTFPDNNVVRVGVQYRQTSYAIKGQSLTNIDQLIRLYQKCGGGKMLVLQNNAGLKETEERLIQLRKDEVKYYLLQRRVPKDDMIFSDNS